MINEISLLYYILYSANLVLCFYVIILPKKYWYWILILQYFLDTDTASVFFRLNTDTDTSVLQKHTEY
jgi:hypothetical protein